MSSVVGLQVMRPAVHAGGCAQGLLRALLSLSTPKIFVVDGNPIGGDIDPVR